MRATFTSIEDLLKLPADQFGSPEEWLPFKGKGQTVNEIFDDSDLIAEDTDDNEDSELIIFELGHVPSLREYLDQDVDRKPELVRQYITDLLDGTDLGDGWYEIAITNRAKYGIPGRLLSTCSASLAKLTKEARAVAVQGRCQDLDFPASHLFSLAYILDSMNILNEFPMIKRFRT